jgi:hypothetical protein
MDSNQGRSWSDVDGLGTQGTLTIMKETHTTPGELRANHAQVFVGLAGPAGVVCQGPRAPLE